ncbi:MAG: hypothetical protein J3K34DRAFT_419252 [Monoraphidium minutum]|nr:MAG: hypothetical protein J3K34DRAFT_419252 [Monoraphidium minutum]
MARRAAHAGFAEPASARGGRAGSLAGRPPRRRRFWRGPGASGGSPVGPCARRAGAAASAAPSPWAPRASLYYEPQSDLNPTPNQTGSSQPRRLGAPAERCTCRSGEPRHWRGWAHRGPHTWLCPLLCDLQPSATRRAAGALARRTRARTRRVREGLRPDPGAPSVALPLKLRLLLTSPLPYVA